MLHGFAIFFPKACLNRYPNLKHGALWYRNGMTFYPDGATMLLYNTFGNE